MRSKEYELQFLEEFLRDNEFFHVFETRFEYVPLYMPVLLNCFQCLGENSSWNSFNGPESEKHLAGRVGDASVHTPHVFSFNFMLPIMHDRKHVCVKLFFFQLHHSSSRINICFLCFASVFCASLNGILLPFWLLTPFQIVFSHYQCFSVPKLSPPLELRLP